MSFLLASLLFAPALAPQEETKPELFDRVVVVGASLSDGYGLRSEVEANIDFGTVLGAALRSDSARVSTKSDSWFFQQPTAAGTRLIEEVVEEKPTLVVALDYLFWFAFRPSGKTDRIDGLKNGLTLLKKVECPLIIADFPDMSIALEGKSPFGYPLIEEHMLPDAETLATLNELIRTWAAEREHTYVIPIAGFFSKMQSDEDVKLRDNLWAGNSVKEILQEDLLHPTLAGDIGLAILTLDTLIQQREGIPEGAFRWKREEIRARVFEVTEEEREKNRERARKREERKRRREEKRKNDRDSDQLVQPPR